MDRPDFESGLVPKSWLLSPSAIEAGRKAIEDAAIELTEGEVRLEVSGVVRTPVPGTPVVITAPCDRCVGLAEPISAVTLKTTSSCIVGRSLGQSVVVVDTKPRRNELED